MKVGIPSLMGGGILYLFKFIRNSMYFYFILNHIQSYLILLKFKAIHTSKTLISYMIKHQESKKKKKQPFSYLVVIVVSCIFVPVQLLRLSLLVNFDGIQMEGGALACTVPLAFEKDRGNKDYGTGWNWAWTGPEHMSRPHEMET